MPKVAPVIGYVCLVSNEHAVELHDLSEEGARDLMEEARLVSRALSLVTKAVKLNYEIHGNTLPHFHIHFFPRYRGDRFESRPIDPKAAGAPVYQFGEFERLRNSLLEELKRSAT